MEAMRGYYLEGQVLDDLSVAVLVSGQVGESLLSLFEHILQELVSHL
jgi:hypothetical protein